MNEYDAKRLWIFPPLNGEPRMYAARSDSLRQNIWTDPWDGKQKVMERRQPQVRADLLPSGVTAGANGKWTFNPGPTAEFGANLQKARPLTQNSINVDAGGLARAIATQAAGGMAQELAAVQAKARAALAAAPKELKVGGRVRVVNTAYPVSCGKVGKVKSIFQIEGHCVDVLFDDLGGGRYQRTDLEVLP